MATVSINNITDTWNAAGTTFTGIKFNVTDIASAAASLLMDLQVGGVSKFKVDKAGIVSTNGMSVGDAFSSNAYRGIFPNGSYQTEIRAGGGTALVLSVSSPAVTSVTIPANSTTCFGIGNDVTLYRDAANTLAQRNGTNEQTFRVYNTFTDASNYERGFLRWSSGRFQIGQEAAGSGASRSLNIFQAHNRQIEFSSAGLYIWHDTGSSATSGFIPGELRLCTNKLGFGSGNVSTSSDAGIVRTAAAKLKVTDGSTGTGQLVFIVPTTDPAVAGALWNDAGTLKVSAG